MKKIFIVAISVLFISIVYGGIKFSPNQIYIGQTITFSIDDSKGCTGCSWDFGDGTKINNVADNTSVTHIYTVPGNYTVTFTSSGCVETPPPPKILILTVLDNRTIQIAPNNPKVNENITITLNHPIKTPVHWDFGDGTPKETANATVYHKYANPGNYKITAMDSGAPNFPVFYNIQVSPDTRKIIFNPNPAMEGQNISFTATNFKSSNLRWDFGDGTKKTGSANIKHFYRQRGYYTVKTVENNNTSLPPVETKVKITKDVRTLCWQPKTPYVGETVRFKISLFNTNANNFLWKFGDGKEQRNSGMNITHLYKRTGTFVVKVFDMNGVFGTPTIAKINILNDPRKVLAKPMKVFVGQKAIFEALNFKSSNLLWNFGDGNKKTAGSQTIHKYKRTGMFVVKVNDKNGEDKKTFSMNITALPDPRKLEINSKDLKLGQEIIIKALNFYSDKILWNFGDGITKIDKSTVKHIYGKAGTFTIKATDYAGDDDKCFEKSLTIKISPSQVSSLVISGGEIYFKNNYKSFIIIPKNYKNIQVIAKIKFEGTGNLTGYWSIDDQKYRGINQNLSFGQKKEFIFKGIPTILSGLHKINFSVNLPKSDFNLNCYYFVSPTNKKIKLISPDDKYKSESRIIVFKWKKLNLNKVVYILKLSTSMAKLFNKSEIKKSTGKNSLKIDIGKIDKAKEYFWIIEANDNNGEILAISEVRTIKIKK